MRTLIIQAPSPGRIDCQSLPPPGNSSPESRSPSNRPPVMTPTRRSTPGVLPTLIGGATASSSVNSGLTLSSFISFGRISDSGRVLGHRRSLPLSERAGLCRRGGPTDFARRSSSGAPALAAAIGRIRPRRHQKRHVIFAFRLGDGKRTGTMSRNGGSARRRAPPREILADRKAQFVGRDRDRHAAEQRLVGAAVGIGDGALEGACARPLPRSRRIRSPRPAPDDRHACRARGSRDGRAL